MIETRTVALGDLAFTVDSAGPAGGAPVLLLHGFPETRHMWRRQLEALGAAGLRAIAPDQRGYARGARPREEGAYATSLLVEDALGLMDAEGRPRFLEEGAIEGAMSWYRASGIGVPDTPTVAVPTLYVWGTDDATVGRRAAELTVEYVTGPYRFIEVEGAGHFIVDQMPERVSSLLLEHVRSSGG